MLTLPRLSPAPLAPSALEALPLTGREVTFGTEEIIVSKTDLKGHITYANPVFCRVAGYTERELVGQPHNLIRHPAMPRGVFKLLWDTISRGEEIFAYVVNRTRHGDAYWVLAHVTATFDVNGSIIAYHSTRRSAEARAVDKVRPLYAAMVEIEAQHARRADAMTASARFLSEQLAQVGLSYEQFVFSL
ncbi:MAG: PAS domain-containing protein [Archangiaceae bacterium]|nr:PAS domain-containing protein [Archangiaceae bacterium]